MKVGALSVDLVYDGYGDQVARDILHLPGKPDAWDACAQYLHDAENIRLICGGYLLRAGDRVVLVDAGIGTYQDEEWHGGQFLDSLRALGVTPAEVTDVVFTHLHWDHCGWATHDGEVVFGNATYRVHRADWAHFVAGPDADPEDVQHLSPIAGRLEVFDAETTLLPGFDALPVPGHTPGSTIYVASSGGDRLLLIGDVLHTPAQVTDLGWEVMMDVDNVAAKRVRAELITSAADNPDVIGAAHFPFGHVITVDGEHRFRFSG
jgi:glyoxylase-like metal-dependent hydrolase (beta-lactamase superfamily II)